MMSQPVSTVLLMFTLPWIWRLAFTAAVRSETLWLALLVNAGLICSIMKFDTVGKNEWDLERSMGVFAFSIRRSINLVQFSSAKTQCLPTSLAKSHSYPPVKFHNNAIQLCNTMNTSSLQMNTVRRPADCKLDDRSVLEETWPVRSWRYPSLLCFLYLLISLSPRMLRQFPLCWWHLQIFHYLVYYIMSHSSKRLPKYAHWGSNPLYVSFDLSLVCQVPAIRVRVFASTRTDFQCLTE